LLRELAELRQVVIGDPKLHGFEPSRLLNRLGDLANTAGGGFGDCQNGRGFTFGFIDLLLFVGLGSLDDLLFFTFGAIDRRVPLPF
jgi:hypothetical protein